MKVPVLIVVLSFLSVPGSQALPSNSTGCSLDFIAYKPAGECVHPDENEVIVWDNVRTTQCCRSGLYYLSRALAKAHSNSQNQAELLTQQEWQTCTSFFSKLDAASLGSCGFDSLHRHNGNCSSLSLPSVKETYGVQYNSTLKSCSQLNNVSNFVDRCANCTIEMSNMIQKIIQDLKVQDDGTEKAICSVATIAVVASSNIGDDTWTDDYYRCMAAMDSEDRSCKHTKHDVVKIILETLIALMALVLLFTIFKFKRSKKADQHKQDTNAPGKMVSIWSGVYRFSKAEIEKAINYSSSRICLGAGSAGQVYQGVLPSGQLVAIKHIFKTAMNSSFTREVEGLSKVRHPNLVSLLGYCDEIGDKYLVYEYCSNGNLAYNLLRNDAFLPWDKRVKILRYCSLALRFLHTHPDGCIVHRDIKLTNILLTERMEPKLSDFGLARMVGMKETQCYTDVRGTIGYMDPEYMTNGNLTCASDIYSFGIVILQVLSGRKVIELNTEARDTLTRRVEIINKYSWFPLANVSAKDVSAGKRPLEDFVDPRLGGKLNLEDFKSILNVAVLCVAGSSKGRPRISDLVGEIEKACKNMPVQTRRQISASSRSQSLEVVEV